MEHSKTKIVVLLIGVFFLSTSAIFVKIIEAPTVVIAFYRLFFSAVMMLPFIISNVELKKEFKSVSRNQFVLVFISGILLACHYVLWFESLNYTSVTSSTVIVTLQPIFAVLAGFVLFNDRINYLGLMGVLLSILGSCFIGWQDFDGNSMALYGDFLALISAIFITGYFLIGQSLRKNMSVLIYSIIGYFSSAVVLLGYGMFKQVSFVGFDKSIWIMFLAMALFSTLLGQMAINWVLKWINTITVSTAILTEVVWASLLSMWILNEQVTFKQVIGIMIVIVGLLIYSYRDRLILKIETMKRFLEDI